MEYVSQLWPYVAALIGVGVVVLLAKNWIVKVPSGKIAILENVLKGKQIETGRILARDNEMGVLRRYIKQGWHFVPFPLRKVKHFQPIFIVQELGFVVAKDGAQLPPDRKFADDPAGDVTDPAKDFHNKFQDPDGFYEHGGIRGPQLRLLTAGPHFIHPELFDVKEMPRTRIGQGKVGVVYARDGHPLDNGQVLSKKVKDHDRFQNAAAFIKNGGQIGPQIEVLPPGVYNINREMFDVQEVDALKVPQGKISILISKIGKPLPKGEVCATTPSGDDNLFTDAQAFIDASGYQGPQSRTLGAGVYYLNPLAFDHEEQPLYEVKPGFVAARISFIGTAPGMEPSDGPENVPTTEDKSLAQSATDPAATRVNSGVREVTIVNDGERGLQKRVLSPGMYPFNHYAEKLIDWPITVRTIEWANPESKDENTNYFNRFEIDSNDGQKMKVDVRLNYRVLAEDVPFVIRNLGSLDSLEAGVIHPHVENIFRNQVTKSPAINYVQNRAKEVEEALAAAKTELRPYRVEVTGLLITDLIPPEKLTELLSAKSLAEQEKDMWTAKETAQNARIAFENKSAEADQQKSLRQAETSIKIAENEASATKKRAEGEAARIVAVGEANATATRATGTAEADIIKAKGEAAGHAYEEQGKALGKDNLARLEVTRALQGLKIPLVPQIQLGGGANGEGGGDMANLVAALLLPQLVGQLKGQPSETDTPAAAVEPETPAPADDKK
jgi:regulator of protease activity HflC (stomatin/prohibitin superfamily)